MAHPWMPEIKFFFKCCIILTSTETKHEHKQALAACHSKRKQEGLFVNNRTNLCNVSVEELQLPLHSVLESVVMSQLGADKQTHSGYSLFFSASSLPPCSAHSLVQMLSDTAQCLWHSKPLSLRCRGLAEPVSLPAACEMEPLVYTELPQLPPLQLKVGEVGAG